MFRVKMLFSTVSISNSNYCLKIFTLPGNWAMLENKLHIWSLLRGRCWQGEVNVARRDRVRTLVSYWADCKQLQGWGGESRDVKGDNGWLFCTSVHSQKRENHVY